MGRTIVTFLAIWVIFFAVFYLHQAWTLSGWKAVGKATWWGLVAAVVTTGVLAAIVYVF